MVFSSIGFSEADQSVKRTQVDMRNAICVANLCLGIIAVGADAGIRPVVLIHNAVFVRRTVSFVTWINSCNRQIRLVSKR